MKIELSLTSSYLPSWTQFDAIRELVSNGQDAQKQFDAPFTVKHRKDTNTLVLVNDGANLPHEALLFGHTTKAERGDLIGTWGEGLKISVMVLVRSGHSVKIRSGSEVWIPSIQRSDKFNADVLVFDISTGREPKNRVSVEVGNIDAETWVTMKGCFLFLDDIKDNECVKTGSGSLLLGERFAGKLYCKGIFVQNDPAYSFGYDLSDATLDRDRRLVEKYSLQSRTQQIWREALGRRPDLTSDYGKLLENETADTAGIEGWNASYLSDDVKKAVTNEFLARHGEQAIPCPNLGESQEVAHLGKKGVVVPKALRHVLEQLLGSVESNKAKLKNEATTRYSWDDLTVYEGASVERAISMVNAVAPIAMDVIEVVDFRDPKIDGMYQKTETGERILLAKRILFNRALTLETLVHEVAHRVGNDGTQDHVSRIEHIWSKIVSNLTDKVS